MKSVGRMQLVILCVLLLVGCANEPPTEQAASTPEATQTRTLPTQPLPTITASPLPPTPTATPEPPSVARVNGQSITVESFQKELSRYEAAQQALGRDMATEGSLHQVVVLDALIEKELILQAAALQGISMPDDTLDVELTQLIEVTGGQTAFDEWLGMNQYTVEEFREELRAQIITQSIILRIIEQVPGTAEQVHARHIVVDSREIGNGLLVQLQEGADFAQLAIEHSLDESTRLGGGDLGFFPRGLLLSPEVEEVAFGLGTGMTSDLVESEFGYHIIEVLERDPARSLTPEMQQRLRTVAFEQWLETLWAAATVERNL